MTGQKQIALDLGVSVATVSNALAGKGRVSDSVIKQVNQRARQLGYIPSPAGRALKTGRSGIIGFVMPDVAHPLFPKLAQGVEAEADKCGLGVLIADSRGTAKGQDRAISQLLKRGVDGVVIVPQRGTSPQVSDLPVAIINTPTDPANTVSANHQQGGEIAAECMRQLGHRHLLLLGADKQSAVQRDRIAGMSSILQTDCQFQVYWSLKAMPDARQLIARGVTAVIAVSDILALGVLTQASQVGVRCPEQLSIMGFDDLPAATAVTPRISTVVPDIQTITSRAVNFLVAAIGEQHPLPSPSSVDMRVLIRESTGPVNHQHQSKI